MNLTADEALVRTLPLPIAQLYRRAHNAKTPLERHQAAFYLWEAALKLLSAVVVVEYADLGQEDPRIAARLRNLVRPSLGHWWEFVRTLVPILAEADGGRARFGRIRDWVLGPERDDLPRAAALDAALRDVLGAKLKARVTVRLHDLLARLVQYRNQEFGHGAQGQRSTEFYDRMGRAILSGAGEVLAKSELLGVCRLVYIADVRRQGSGDWLVERYDLVGESVRRLESLELPRSETAGLPDPERVYVESQGATRSLHPLVLFDHESGEFFFINSRHGKHRAEYLCYSTGRVADREDLGVEQRQFLASVLGEEIDVSTAEAWTAVSRREDVPEAVPGGPPPSRRIGEFELISKIGRGGMGVVYRAWQPSLGRQVALKCLLSLGDPKTEARFAREIRSLGRVEHPNLAKIFTSGTDGDQWYYAMELIEGADLTSICDFLAGTSASEVGEEDWRRAISTACDAARKREEPIRTDPPAPPTVNSRPAGGPSPLSWADGLARCGPGHISRIVEIVRQIAEAAHSLHDAGVIHRDIKPGNIMLTADGSHAVLMDLGLAQLADDAQGRLTRTRQFVGTLRYASPEQILAAGPMDRRTDIYSLGATLWELLTLRPLFGAGESMPTPDLMLRIQTTDPERPRRINPRIPRDLEEIVLKCLEKDRNRRYATARELAADLRRWQRGEPVTAGHPSFRYILGKAMRRYKARIAVGAVLLLMVILGVVAAFLRIEQARLVAEEARAHLQLTISDAYTAQGLSAGNEGKPAQALLWFAGATAWANGDPSREDAARTRVRTWSDLVHVPVRALPLLGEEIRSISFHPSGRYLMAIGARGRPWILDLIEDRDVPVPGEDRSVSCAAWNPDGDLLAFGSPGGVVEILDFPGVARHHALEVSGGVSHLTFSPDGRLLAIAADGARVWECGGRRFLGPDLAHPRPVLRVGFSSRSDRLVTLCGDGTARVFAVPRIADDPRPLFDPVPAVALPIHLDGDRILLDQRRDQEVAWLDASTGKPLRPDLVDMYKIHRLIPSPDGKYILLCGVFRAQLFEVASGRQVGADLTHALRVVSGDFSPNGSLVVTVSDDRSARIWTVPQGRSAGPPVEHQDGVSDVLYSPCGRFFATVQQDGLVRVWRRSVPFESDRYIELEHGDTLFAMSADGKSVMPGGWRLNRGLRETRVHDVATGRPAGRPLQVGGLLNGAAISPDGRQAVTLSSLPAATSTNWADVNLPGEPGWIQFWDVRSGKRLVPPLETLTEPVGAAYAPAGGSVVVVCAGGQILVLDPDTGWIRTSLQHEGSSARPAAPVLEWVRFSPDGRLFVTWGLGNAARVWDASTWKPLQYHLEHEDLCCFARFSPDGRWLLTASLDRTARIWDVETGRAVAEPLRHPDGVPFATFSPDGRHVLTASLDHAARLWDWRSGRLVGVPMEHRDEMNEADFSPDGRWVATAARDDSLQIWDPFSGKPVAPTRLLPGHGYQVQFTPDGEHIVTSGFMTYLEILDVRGLRRPSPPLSPSPPLDPDSLQLLGEVIAGRRLHAGAGVVNLTSEEWVERWRACSKDRDSMELFRYAGDREAELLGRVNHLRAEGNPAEAARCIREAIGREPEVAESGLFWDLWFTLSVRDLKMGARAVLDGFPNPAGGDLPRVGASLLSALEELSERGAIRIDCGAQEPRNVGGTTWGKDRFFVSGFSYDTGPKFRISLTEDARLYQTERYFMVTGLEVGYRIPLLPGKYRVILHFAETYHKSPGQRFFDVLLEGGEALRNYEPAAIGFATADRHAFEVDVTDGFLEVSFVARLKDPKLCALEVEPIAAPSAAGSLYLRPDAPSPPR